MKTQEAIDKEVFIINLAIKSKEAEIEKLNAEIIDLKVEIINLNQER